MTSMSKQIRNSLLLVLTAFIWGIAFVAQSKGGQEVGPYSFNCIRSLIGSLVLLPVMKILDHLKISSRRPVTKEDKKRLWKAGICCGIPLFIATNLQQLGIYYGTSAGKAGFLTACYIVLVPVFGLFLKRKCHHRVWIAVGITLVGLYQLCMTETFSLAYSDLLVIACAAVFSVQILVVDHYSPVCDGVRMSCIQLLVSGVLGLIPMFFFEMNHSMEGIKAWLPQFTSVDAWIAILYAGVLSCGVAYTLQIVAQNGLNPAVASLIMSLESVFSVLAGAVILKEYLSGKELIGCALIFLAIVLVQLPGGKGKKDESNTNC